MQCRAPGKHAPTSPWIKHPRWKITHSKR